MGVIALTGCSVETIVHDLDEREANRILELLHDHEINASKSIHDTGRSVTYTISVSGGNRMAAIGLLNKYELPRRRDKGYNDIFQESGLIPTSAEEKAKKLAALEGEIERQLKLIDGILDVQAQLVVPDETALRTTQNTIPTTTASVTIKYLPGAGGSKPLSEPQVQAVVAAGVEKLTPDNVVVVMTPGGRLFGKPGPMTAGIEAPRAAEHGLKALSSKQLNLIIAAFVALIAVLGLGLWFAQIRLRAVRGRLIRLQTEIAKARRRPGESVSAPG